jgi:alkanesulfonate monooxygenase
MSVEFIGMIQSRQVSEIHPAQQPAVDRAYTKAFAQIHEQAGFDRILVPFNSTGVDSTITIAYAAAVTERIHFMLAHRPGFVAPTVAARQLATLDQFTGGRLAVHYISGGSDAEQRRDGDYLDHDQRYRRTDEYLDVLRRVWTAEQPFDHAGEYYRFEQAWSEVKPLQQPTIPVFFGGSSEAAIRVAGKHADVYALWGESLAQVREVVGRVRAEAALYGRTVRFSLSLRPILAASEEAAWGRAEAILQQIQALKSRGTSGRALGYNAGGPQQSVGAQRLLAAAGDGVRTDKRLWTAIAKEIGGRSNSTALVGTPEQVAESLLDYYDAGISTFLIRGFDPLQDAIEYGRVLIPLTRQLVAQREVTSRRAA